MYFCEPLSVAGRGGGELKISRYLNSSIFWVVLIGAFEKHTNNVFKISSIKIGEVSIILFESWLKWHSSSCFYFAQFKSLFLLKKSFQSWWFSHRIWKGWKNSYNDSYFHKTSSNHFLNYHNDYDIFLLLFFFLDFLSSLIFINTHVMTSMTKKMYFSKNERWRRRVGSIFHRNWRSFGIKYQKM